VFGMAGGISMETSMWAVLAVITLGGVLSLLRPLPAAAASPGRTQDTATHDQSLEQQVISAERAGLDALKSGNLEQFAALTADDAILVDAQGPANKAQVMKNVAGFKLTDYLMEDVKFLAVSPNTGLVSYKITEKGVSHGKEFAAQAYISSVWTHRGTQWLCLFSQETGVPKRPTPGG
jgi:ketosteroid isomerase-like protein